MKTSLVIPLALFAVFTISEISCEETCLGFNEKCLADSDCCSKNCFLSGNVENRYCMDFPNATYGVKVQKGLCSYDESFHNDTSDETYGLFGLNAAHAVLPVGSKIKLTNTANNQTIDVTINTYLQSNNETILQLSKELANELGVKNGEKIPCSISLTHSESNYSTLKTIAGVSASFFVVVFVIISFL